ncbi:hypothetical protein F5Y06DRAFT_275335 [Hypoxylon sp. FL0890]|nr:hypothetical protein F5Y06DRAFT_275335 [Hypoxylon sp. FL0890]
MQPSADHVAYVLSRVSRNGDTLSTYENEVDPKVLDDMAVQGLTEWSDWIWREQNTLRLWRYMRTTTQLQADISRALVGLDRLESRLRRVLEKNEERKKKKNEAA